MCDCGTCVDGDVRIVFMKSESISGDFYLSLDEYDRAFYVVGASSVQGCVKREQRVFASLEFEVQREMLNEFVLIRREKIRKEHFWVGKVLLLFHFLVNGGSDENELAFVRYMEFVARLDEMGEALKCVCAVGDFAL